ncbi:MAG: tyrosine-type recombinase/integrase, partial [Dehalococcoidales bacterium]
KYLLEWQAGLPGPVSDRTCELYEYLCRVHIIPAIGSHPLAQLRNAQIQSLYSAKLKSGLSPRTAELIIACLHKALKNAVKTGLLTINPADNVTKVKPERHEMKTLQEGDINVFLAAAKKTDYYPLFFTYLYTGLRRSELLSVKWSDCDLLGMTLSVNRGMEFVKNKITFKAPKTKTSRRLIALTPKNCVVLREHRAAQDRTRQQLDLAVTNDNDLVFAHEDGSPLLPNTITHVWIKLVRRNGFYGVRLHDARHTHASLLLKQGVHPKVVQERLGHASIAMTLDTYSHTVQGMQKAAAANFDTAIESGVSESNSLDSR